MRLPGTRSVTRDARAVVTGAGSGIGRSLARELARRGGQVVCSDIRRDRAEETVDFITEAGGRGAAVACDVTALEAVEELARRADEILDRPVDLVVNNAGIGAGGPVVGELSMDDWRATIDVNLWGVIHGCHVFAPRLRAQDRGAILNVASAASFAAFGGMAAYNVSKAGVLSLSETLAAELAGTGVRVAVLCPTFVETNIVRDGRIDEAQRRVARRVMATTGRSPESIARVALQGLDRGRLYVLPQVEARALWRAKRHTPRAYLAGTRLVGRALGTA